MTAALGDSERKLVAADQNLATARSELDSRTKDVALLGKELEDSRAALDARPSRDQLEKAKADLEAMALALRSRTEEVETEKHSAQELHAALGKAEEALREKGLALEKSASDRRDLRSTITSSDAERTKQAQELAEIKEAAAAKLAALELEHAKKLRASEDDLATVPSERDSLTKQVAVLTKELDEARLVLEPRPSKEEVAEASALRADLERARAEVARLSSALIDELGAG